jgi:NhaP-type Na+/H+ or K+/H+ antiporter
VVSALRLGVIGTVCARLWRVGDTLVVIVLVIAAVILFARGTSVFISLDKQKLEVLRRFNGQTVTLGIGVRGIIEQTGTLVIGEDRLRVTLLNGTPRAVPVADIRWITDPISGTRVAGPW